MVRVVLCCRKLTVIKTLCVNNMIPIDEQLYAITHAKNWELANKYFNGDHDQLNKNWTVTDDDIYNYIIKNDFPKGWVHTSEATYDGLYILEQDNKWLIYEKERGRIYENTNKYFETYSSAVQYIIKAYYSINKNT